MLRFTLSAGATKSLRSLSKKDQERIADAIARHAATSHGDVKPLRGDLQGRFRLRIGKWRVIFRKLSESEMLVISIDNRGQAY